MVHVPSTRLHAKQGKRDLANFSAMCT